LGGRPLSAGEIVRDGGPRLEQARCIHICIYIHIYVELVGVLKVGDSQKMFKHERLGISIGICLYVYIYINIYIYIYICIVRVAF
jgi:hypothetical protein